jgi:hypothetical protein
MQLKMRTRSRKRYLIPFLPDAYKTFAFLLFKPVSGLQNLESANSRESVT